MKLHYITISLFIIFIFCSKTVLYGQCKILRPTDHICKNTTITLSVNTNAYRFEWKSGAGQTESKKQVTFLYDTFGTFKITVELFDSLSNKICSDSFLLTVYDLPKAEAKIADSLVICNNSSFCFQNLSVPGASKAPLYEYVWLFGDGDISSLKEPCHKYKYSAPYYIFLKVKDTNQCESNYRKLVYINITPAIKTLFAPVSTDSCPVTDALFKNLTDSSIKKDSKWKWDFGDGTSDTTSTKWTNFIHQYKTNGIFSPSLTITTKYGCTEKFTCPNCVRNVIFDFLVDVNPKVACFEDNRIYFNNPVNNAIDLIYWNFDDPGSGNFNTAYGWSVDHVYSKPGTYSPYVLIKQGNCIKDTTLCDKVVIYGPQAVINVPAKANNYLPYKKMDFDELLKKLGNCKFWAADSVVYVTIQKKPPFISYYDSIYCNAKISNTIITPNACGADSQKILGNPTSLIPVYDSVQILYKVVFPGDSLPLGEIYFPPSGTKNTFNMHDTDLVKPDCSAPNYVLFVNNSQKWRGYDALDNYPPYKRKSESVDRCKNPSYPWASDSMLYFWNFNDSYAKKCTSTVSKSDRLCNFSTEKTPLHLFTGNGCYMVRLTVRDSLTGCTSVDSVKILMTPPDAGYDTSQYDYLNWYLQELFKTDRKGFILGGDPCKGTFQLPDFSETLPTCNPSEWGLVMDSAAQCSHCCTDTFYYDKNNDSVIDTVLITRDTCSWIKSTDFQKKYPKGYQYKSSGCKTVGVYIKVGDCADTFWYHNYKNILEYDAKFKLMNSDSTLSPYYAINMCSPYIPQMVIDSPYQEGVLDYTYIITKTSGRGSPYSATLKCKNIMDTGFVLCLRSDWNIDPVTKDTIYTSCINYPDLSCSGTSFKVPLDSLLKDYKITDTLYFLSLTDTVSAEKPMVSPGTYEVLGILKGQYGCGGVDAKTIGIGYNTSFFISDSVLCKGDTLLISDSIEYYAANPPTGPINIEWDFDNDGKWDTQNVHNPSWVYKKTGIYKIRVHIIDSFCHQDTIIISKGNIYVSGVTADFDTLHSPGICAPQVVEFKDKSFISTHYYYVYDSLGHFKDSVQLDPLFFWQWDFGDSLGWHSTSYLQDPGHVYVNNGVFSVWMKVQTLNGCIDSVFKKDYISISGPKADFYLLDTFGCAPFSARIVNLSKSSEQIWNLGNNFQVSKTDKYKDTVLLNYPNPGIYYITLTVSDSVYDPFFQTYKRCLAFYPGIYSGKIRNKVVVLPVNKSAFSGDTVICSGQTAVFIDKSGTAFKDIYWDFGDGDSTYSGQGQTVSHVYTLPNGIYSAFYNLNHDAYGAPCPDGITKLRVHVLDVLSSVNPDTISVKAPLFCFENLSEGGSKYIWKFEDGDPATLTTDRKDSVCSNFRGNRGEKTVCLITQNYHGCTDTDCVTINNNYEYFIYVPNIFTPGYADGVNDIFKISSLNIENYDLTIYNRWGELVFQSNDPGYHWNGNLMNTGTPCAGGSYFLVLNYNFYYLADEHLASTVTLIR